MKRYLESCWIAPVLTGGCAVAAFMSVHLQLFPVPLYLGMTIPVVLTCNLAVLVVQLARRQWMVFVKTAALTCVSAAVCLLWFIQTA